MSTPSELDGSAGCVEVQLTQRDGEVRVGTGRTTGVVRAFHLVRLTLGRLL